MYILLLDLLLLDSDAFFVQGLSICLLFQLFLCRCDSVIRIIQFLNEFFILRLDFVRGLQLIFNKLIFKTNFACCICFKRNTYLLLFEIIFLESDAFFVQGLLFCLHFQLFLCRCDRVVVIIQCLNELIILRLIYFVRGFKLTFC